MRIVLSIQVYSQCLTLVILVISVYLEVESLLTQPYHPHFLFSVGLFYSVHSGPPGYQKGGQRRKKNNREKGKKACFKCQGQRSQAKVLR